MEVFLTVMLYVLAGVIGLCVGSFLNVVIYRVPQGMSLAFPPSHCPKCNYTLRWYDNIPLLSYLILRGRCRKCGEKISFRYTVVELANMIFWLLSVALFWDKSIPFAFVAAFASSALICVFFIDLKHKLIYDRFNVILAVLAVVAVFFDPYYDWLSHVIGGAVGFVSFYGISFLFYKIKHKEGLGGGDIKLTAACGLLLGWQRLLFAILVASLIACIVLIILNNKKRKNGKDDDNGGEYPFAPFLTTAFVCSMFLGNFIISAYLSLLGL